MKKITIFLEEQQRMIVEEIKRIEHEIKSAVDGRLRISVNHGHPQYYHVTNKGDDTGKYLPKKKEYKKIKELAQKDYDKKMLDYLSAQREMNDKMIKLCQKYEVQPVYQNLSEVRKSLVCPSRLDGDAYAKIWENVKYNGKPFSDDSIRIITEKGERVRSKSEKIIADKLYMMNIPYRYECPLHMKSYGTIYPDFTLLDSRTHKEIILEHFGMMDLPEYANKAIKKIHIYEKNGYYLGRDLLATFETSTVPVDMKAFEEMISLFVG